jgi:hypothetical protein
MIGPSCLALENMQLSNFIHRFDAQICPSKVGVDHPPGLGRVRLT